MATIKLKRNTEAILDNVSLADYEIAFTTDTKKIVVFDGTNKIKYLPADSVSLTEAIQDVLGSTIIDSTTLDGTYDDNAGTFSIEVKDNQITLAKLDHGAQGDILYYGFAGAPTRLSAGTAGYALLTGGSGANPSWGKITWSNIDNIPSSFTPSAHGSSVHTGTIGSASQISAGTFPSGSFDFTSAQKLKMRGMYPATDSTTAIQLYKADGSTAVVTVDTTNSRVGFNNTAPALTGAISTPQTHVTQITGALSIGEDGQGGNNDGLIQLSTYGFASCQNWNSWPTFGVNIAVKSDGSTDTIYTPLTHATMGYSGIQFRNGNGFYVYSAWNTATTAGATITPTPVLNLTNGTLGIGTGATQAAKRLEVRDTSAQLRLSYDGSYYTDFMVNSAGNLTIAPYGGSFGITGNTLSINSTTNYCPQVQLYNNNDLNTGSYFMFYRSRAGSAPVASSDALGNIWWHGMCNSTYRQAAYISAGVDGSPSGNYVPGVIAFGTATASAGPTERMRITSSGYVGINTTSPSKRLEVLDTSAQLRLSYDGSNYTDFTTGSGGNLAIQPYGRMVSINTTSTRSSLYVSGMGLGSTAGSSLSLATVQYTVGNYCYLDISATRTADGTDWNNTEFLIQRTIDTVKMSFIKLGHTTSLGNTIQLGYGTTPHMTVGYNNGCVGINTTAPAKRLEVRDTSAQLRLSYDGSYSTSFLCNSTGYLYFSYNDTYLTVFPTSGGMYPYVNETMSLGTIDNRWNYVFAKYVGATATRLTNGYFTNITSTNAVTVDSDARWKEDISGTYGLDLVNAIPAHSFKWRENSGRADGVRHQGFIAQEFQQRLLELGISDKDLAVVKYDSENDEYGLATGELIPILWRAIQQLSAKVAALEAA